MAPIYQDVRGIGSRVLKPTPQAITYTYVHTTRQTKKLLTTHTRESYIYTMYSHFACYMN